MRKIDMLEIAGAVFLGLVLYGLLNSHSIPDFLVKKKGLLGIWDVTDDAANSKRSNLRIYVDYGTGCQYVGTPFGGLTPRLDKDGRPICLPNHSDN